MLPEAIAAALNIVLDGLAGKPISWVLTGSTAFALRGIPIRPNDIDLQTTKAGAYAIEAVFEQAVTRPVRFKPSPNIRSHLGALTIQGVKVELIGDVQKRLSDGSWTPAPELEEFTRTIPWRSFAVPVLDLGYEAESYRQMGRIKRADMLSAYRDTEKGILTSDE